MTVVSTHDGLPLIHSVVGGSWIEGEGRAPDVNPASPDEPVAWTTRATEETARAAVAAAADAGAAWRRRPATERGELLRAVGGLLDARADEIGRDMAREQGKTLPEAVGETKRAAQVMRYFAGQTLEPDGSTYPSANSSTFLYARREPLGVVAVVTPWNFPLLMPAFKIAPALAFGNTVVWKPAEIVPLTSHHMLQALADAGLPAGVVNLVQGSGATAGATIIRHPAVDAITFTGSNAVGQGILAAAAEMGKRVQLELGGKNPAVVLADADLGHAATTVARAAFLSAGQKCTATSRVIVEEAAEEEFVSRLIEAADGMTVGAPLDPTTEVGPVASEQQLKSVRGYIERGLEQGRVATERAHDEVPSGYFVAPTVFMDLAASSELVQEEIFGPVVAVLPAGSYDEAVELANDVPYGLSASIFTTDLRAAMRFAEDSRTGIVKVNQESTGVEFQAPFGGWKTSGYGHHEVGKVAADFFTHWKTVYIESAGQ
jgi:acyl-CoA reductase-like NAD-dependent aldehyde dehydrogenase